MSRTKHLTRAEVTNKSRPTRRRAKSRLTKSGETTSYYWLNSDRPKNAGNQWRPGKHGGQRHRKEQREDKILGRRLERRRQNRGELG